MEDNKQNIDTARRILNFTKWVNQSKTRTEKEWEDGEKLQKIFDIIENAGKISIKEEYESVNIFENLRNYFLVYCNTINETELYNDYYCIITEENQAIIAKNVSDINGVYDFRHKNLPEGLLIIYNDNNIIEMANGKKYYIKPLQYILSNKKIINNEKTIDMIENTINIYLYKKHKTKTKRIN